MTELLKRAVANVDDAVEVTIAQIAETDDPERIDELAERLDRLDLLATWLVARSGRRNAL